MQICNDMSMGGGRAVDPHFSDPLHEIGCRLPAAGPVSMPGGALTYGHGRHKGLHPTGGYSRSKGFRILRHHKALLAHH